MPRTGGWTETVGAHLIDAQQCIERIMSERATVLGLLSTHVD
jgi:hypothetical protein